MVLQRVELTIICQSFRFGTANLDIQATEYFLYTFRHGQAHSVRSLWFIRLYWVCDPGLCSGFRFDRAPWVFWSTWNFETYPDFEKAPSFNVRVVHEISLL